MRAESRARRRSWHRGTGGCLGALCALAACTGSGDDPCRPVDCSSRGFCIVDQGEPLCACIAGHHPVELECLVNDATDPCLGVACSGHGSCRAEGEQPTCDCDPGYTYPVDYPLQCVPGSVVDGGDCPGATECVPGATDVRACAFGGAESRDCGAGCRWGSWSGCPLVECVTGSEETEPCGACGTGLRRRTCSASGEWEPWAACLGEAHGFPYGPAGSGAICPPYDRPVVFFAAQPMDESVGMGGAIAAELEGGRPVFVELLTHGETSGVYAWIASGHTCDCHDGWPAVTGFTRQAFGEARVVEFLDAMGRFPVTGVYVSNYGDGTLSSAQASERIAWWIAQAGGSGLALRGSTGSLDVRTSGTPHPDNVALWNALTSSGFPDVLGYYVYHYETGAGSPDRTVPLEPEWHAAKSAALGAYLVWNPGAGRYAIGYHSGPTLNANAESSTVEYVDVWP